MVNPIPDTTQHQTGSGPLAEENQLEDYLQYYYMVRSRLWLFLAFPVLAVLGAIIYVQTVTPQYEATCQLLIEPANARVTNIEDVYDPSRLVRNFDAFINTQIRMIQGRDLLAQAFDHFRFGERENYLDAADPLAEFRNSLTVEAQRDTFLINVSSRNASPEEAANVANFISRLYVEEYYARRTGISGIGLERLRGQLEDMRQAREDARRTLSQFKEKQQLIKLSDAQSMLVQRMSGLNRALVEAQVMESQLQAALSYSEEWRQDRDAVNLQTLPENMRNSALQAFKMERLRAQARLPELLSQYSPTHKAVETQQQVIDMLTAAIDQEVANTVTGIQLEYERAQTRRQLLEAAIDALEKESLVLDRVANEYQVLEDTAEAAESSYRMLINRINEINIARNTQDLAGTGNVQVVAAAAAPTRPVSPNKRRMVGMAGFGGVFAGIAICILLGMLDTSVKSKADVQHLLPGWPHLGSVPAFPEGAEAIEAFFDPQGSLSEAFRNIRTSLGLSLVSRGHRIFAVTSAGPGEGKTISSLNLALAMARDNRRTLLIECDMRRPTLNELLPSATDDQSKRGLSQLLVGQLEFKDVVWRDPKGAGPDVVFAGPAPPNPAELLGADRFRALLDQVKGEYDVVILDVPPLLHVADALVIAGCDVPLICIVRLFQTSRHQLRHLLDQAQTVQACVAGIILNNAEADQSGYYYRGRYSYYRGYGSYRASATEPDAEASDHRD